MVKEKFLDNALWSQQEGRTKEGDVPFHRPKSDSTKGSYIGSELVNT